MPTNTQNSIDLEEAVLDQDGENAGGDTENQKQTYTNMLVGEEEESDEG